MNKNVIFLGAGASKAENAPLQNELFNTFYKYERDGRFANSLVHSTSELVSRFMEDFFGVSYDTKNYPTFEEALGIIELAIKNKEEFRGHDEKLYKYRDAIINSMALAIKYSLDDIGNGSMNNYHLNLIKNLHKTDSLKETTFISTNYDLLIDNAIHNAGLVCDYGFSEGSRSVELLKLHGSLNWLYCPVCKKITHKIGEKVMLQVIHYRYDLKCEICNSKLRYIIVPPSYYKDMENRHLKRIWENAENRLLEADNLIFCGYSFPDADMHIKYLLKKSEINKEKQLNVTIINNHPSKSEEMKEQEANRFLRFFKNKTAINYSEMSFEEFSKDPVNCLHIND